MPTQENNQAVYGGFFVRFFAFLVDSLIVGAVLSVIRLPLFFAKLANSENFLLQPVLFKFSVIDIALYLASALYFIVLTYTSGATVGKRLMNLKVVHADGSPLTLLTVVYRETIGRYLSSLLFIGYIMIGLNQDKRGLHDILCDTRVVYTCKCIPQMPKMPPVYPPVQTPPYQANGAGYGFGSLQTPVPPAPSAQPQEPKAEDSENL